MLSEQFLIIIESLKSGDLFKIKLSIDHFLEGNSFNLFGLSRYKKFREEIEKNYYRALAKCLASKRFEDFRQLFNYSDKLEIFIDVKKIPFRFKIISDLHLIGIQAGQIGKIFEIIRFYNEFNLLDRNFSDEELELIENIKRDKLLLANLKDLFGKISNSLIFYSCKIIPHDLYLLFKNYINASIFRDDNFYSRNYYNLSFLLKYFDGYYVYGLSVENLGSIDNFFKKFEKAYIIEKNKLKEEQGKNILKRDLKFIEFYFKNKKHLVSPKNLIKIKDKILAKDTYKFYSLSMVLLGGLGPQGHGFTYSTPKGEIVEICSDIRENDAIIIKYKQFLKQQFLVRLKKKLNKAPIDAKINHKIIKYLNEVLNPTELINYYKKDAIVKQIKRFLMEDQKFPINYQTEFQELIRNISNAITVILRKIKLDDQFKTRMNLIDENKIKSEDIAKLTSLKGKSHYDVLRERLFFQNEIKQFYKDYSDELLKIGNKLI